MSIAEQGIASEINRIKSAVTESYNALRGVETSLGRAYDAIASKGGTVPENKTIDNLEQAITTVSGGLEEVWWSPKMLSNTTSAKQTLMYPDLQEKTVSPSAMDQTVVPDGDYDGLSKVTVTAATLQEKTVTPSESSQIVTPDSAYYGLSKVTTDPIPAAYKDTSDATATADDIVAGKTAYVGSGKITGTAIMTVAPTLQSKSVSPSASQQVITPDANYDGLSQVTVEAATLQAKTVSPSTSQQIITPDSSYYGLSQVTVDAAPVTTPSLQTKTVSPSTSSQNVTPDAGYDGLSKVTVNAATLQSKSVSPSTSAQTITPGSGYYGLSQVSVSAISLQSKTVTPTKSSQTVTATSSYNGLSQVTVNAIPSTYISTTDATATEADIAAGKTAYVNGSLVTGTATLATGDDGPYEVTITLTNTCTSKIGIYCTATATYPYGDHPLYWLGATQLSNGGAHEYHLLAGSIMAIIGSGSLYATPAGGVTITTPSNPTTGGNVTGSSMKTLIGNNGMGFFFVPNSCSITISNN